MSFTTQQFPRLRLILSKVHGSFSSMKRPDQWKFIEDDVKNYWKELASKIIKKGMEQKEKERDVWAFRWLAFYFILFCLTWFFLITYIVLREEFYFDAYFLVIDWNLMLGKCLILFSTYDSLKQDGSCSLIFIMTTCVLYMAFMTHRFWNRSWNEV